MRNLFAFTLLAVLFAGCSGASAPTTTTTTAAPSLTVYATMEGVAPHFAPNQMPAHVGDSVLFKVRDGTHTVDFAETDGLSNGHSGDLGPQTPFAVRFAKAGTFHYQCAYHAGMAGVVTVS